MSPELLEYFNNDPLAGPVWTRKYALPTEVTPDAMHKRMAKEFARIETKYQKINHTPAIWNKLSFYGRHRDELNFGSIYEMFKNFKYIVPQGSIMSQLGSPTIGSLSNCFVAGQPHDSYGGILQKDEELVQLMKRRGGVGLDLSSLRPKGTPTTNTAKSSTGVVPFMERYSNSTREVAQDGRRGALMLSLDVRHPDVVDFATVKNDELKVTGANVSIFLRDDFMQAVEDDAKYFLRFPCDVDFFGGTEENFPLNKTAEWGNLTVKKVEANDIYDKIIYSAWNRAEPGQLFWDRFHNYSPDSVYPAYRGVTTNPCSEIFMQMYDACRLIAVNLFSFVDNPFTPEATFNFKKFHEYNYETQRLMDDLVDLELEAIDAILTKIEKDPEPEEVKATELALWKKIRKTAAAGRRTGTGITALGDTLAALGLGYTSKEGIEMIEKIMHTKMESELDCTIDLAILRGTFEGWDKDKEFPLHKKHGVEVAANDFYQFIIDQFPEQAVRMRAYGRRNVSWSTIAPTGTVSLMTQTTSGLEPLFAPFHTRRVKINPSDKNMRVDFVDKLGDSWMEIPVLHPKFMQWYIIKAQCEHAPQIAIDAIGRATKDELQKIFEESPWFGSTANEIDWQKRVKIQGIIQKYISHSISSTINLPNSATEKDIRDIYIASWKEGLKGVTVYRDGCRSGVLISKSDTVTKEFQQMDAVKRPKELIAETHTTVCGGESFNAIVGLMDGKPYEVFMDNSDNKYSSNGKLVKRTRGKYFFENGGDPVDISSLMSDEQEAITRLVSISLRHGTDIKYIVEQLNKTPGDMFSFTKGLARVLKKYIPDGAKSTVICNDCGSGNVIFEEGCNKCLDCGSSKCG